MEIVCLSLKNREDRRLRSKLNELGTVKWWLVDKHPISGVHGCFESHLQIWKWFQKESQKDYLWVFEDDAELNPEFCIPKLMNDLPTLDYQLINLAPTPLVIDSKFGNGWTSGKYLSLIAYIIPRKYIQEVISHVERYFGIPLDCATLDLRTCAKPIFRQFESPSDISKTSFRPMIQYQWTFTTYPFLGKVCLDYILLNRSNPNWYWRRPEKVTIQDRR